MEGYQDPGQGPNGTVDWKRRWRQISERRHGQSAGASLLPFLLASSRRDHRSSRGPGFQTQL